MDTEVPLPIPGDLRAWDAYRRLLEVHREALRSSFPLDTRAILSALRVGQAPAASGIVML